MILNLLNNENGIGVNIELISNMILGYPYNYNFILIIQATKR